MADTLPKDPFTLTGGCFCKAVTYTVSVPEFSSRPVIEKPVLYPVGLQDEVRGRLPVISVDHCNSCRRVAGSILWAWFIIPLSWVKFSLRSNSPSSSEERIEVDTKAYLIGDKEIREKTHLSHFSSSEGVERTFCGNCGTHLTYYFSIDEEDAPNWGEHFDIAVGTFEKESIESEGFRITKEGHVQDAIPWVRRLVVEGAKAFDV